MVYDYTPFNGDGRRKLGPPTEAKYGTPIGMRPNIARMFIDWFDERSYHISSTGGTLWVIIAWCEKHEIPFHIETHAPEVGGWTIYKGEGS